MTKTLQRSELEQYLRELLSPQDFSDYGPNGLQVEGKREIKKVAFAVSATKDSIEKAVENNADTLIVHHGLFWKFHGVRTITGSFAKRVIPLIENKINLFGYHLPLDAHIQVGNAASIAKELKMVHFEPFGDHKGAPTGIKASFSDRKKITDVQTMLQEILQHDILISCPDHVETIQTMGIITGGANGGWLQASKENLDSYLTGEMSEHDWNEAKEEGIVMFAGGHHATETLGIQNLMKDISENFEVSTFFIDSSNPA